MKIFLPGCILALSTAVLAGCHSTQPTQPAAPETVSARVVESQQQQVPVGLRSTGTIHAKQTATISAQVVSRIQQVLVHEGESVRAGQTLVILDDAALRSSVAQAQAGVRAALNQQAAAESGAKLAASTLDRYRQLQAQQSVSPQEMDEVAGRAQAATSQLDAVRAQTEAAKAQETGARTMLGYTRLLAPFSGVVTARMADPGTLAASGVPLVQIDQAGPLQLQATVDESAIAVVHKGMKLKVVVDSASAELTGSVQEILPAADPGSHSFIVKIDLPPSTQLHAGMYGAAEFSNGMRQAIVIPRSAVAQRGSLACAYVLDGRGIAQLRYLTLGATQGNLVEVLSGLSANEKLVDAPSDRDLAGKRIEASAGGQQ
ncbi:MAG: efflux RND transporter periplasmic adaptor subunit [Terracidiphilus sp.]|nr:efflux RND transporter periplasmic adaptor subunit [Terracidiphilus sp.]